MADKKTNGDFGEKFTEKYLKKKGYKIAARNFHSRFGEIDVIAVNKEYILFVEVKTREEDSLFLPREAVDYFKQQRCVKTAKYYLLQNPCELQPRFDVSEVVLEKDKLKVKRHTYLENAF